MNHEMDMQKYEGWLIQLCKEQRPLNDITVSLEQVTNTSQESYVIQFQRKENGSVANSRSVTVTKDVIDDLSAGQSILRAISEV